MRTVLHALLSALYLGSLAACIPDSTLTPGNRPVRLVPLFRSTAVSPVPTLRTSLIRPGHDSAVQLLPYRSGDWIVLGSVEAGDSFTVSLTGLDSSEGTTLARWTIRGSGRAGAVSEQSVPLGEPETAPSIATLALADTLFQGSLLSLPMGLWSWTSDGSDPRVSATARRVQDSLRAASLGRLCLARMDSTAGRAVLWSDSVCTQIEALPAGNWMQDKAGKAYPTVTLGTQTWMARNLDWQSPDSSWCLFDSASNCETYGRLYAWSQAQQACPSGWHLPTKAEWITLLDSYTLSQLLSDTGWSAGNNGSNSTGFAILPGELFFNGEWGYGTVMPNEASFWSASHTEKKAFMVSIQKGSTEAIISEYEKTNGYSVRCLKD